MELQQEKSTLIEEASITETNVQIKTNFSNGNLLLTAEKMSLAEEIKILIRKLWD